ncbi:EF-hand pair protein (macronuclear) [Tetrahymena thermophila SB210]|uniref:EF-hand pair protein n=1 Tax=Tetrahymena thermophila (strain SB210) TaxID=312017 RepID=Q231P8_TETTS|nr:EF-hand pair protein [Tetrahymena thermophila SB210]EAR91254.3 EF-hand pair protein [Tetrahymena thermophila SB210]|eukprot:XP_001011499.3 EF-hand pair protein [Tetrahymena thermophila SB210]
MKKGSFQILQNNNSLSQNESNQSQTINHANITQNERIMQKRKSTISNFSKPSQFGTSTQIENGFLPPAGTYSTLQRSKLGENLPKNQLKLMNRNITVQYLRKKQLDEAIQMKQRQMFLDAQAEYQKQKSPKKRADENKLNNTLKLSQASTYGFPNKRISQSAKSFKRDPNILYEGTRNLTSETLAKLESQKYKQKDNDFNEIVKSSADNELQYYRFRNPKTVEIERKGRIQTFIYDKKVQNRLKYSDRSKINTTALPVPKGSISVMLNVAKKDYGFNLDNFKKKIPAKSKFKMKWKTIQWLLQNKQDVIKQLFSNYSLMLKFAKNKKEGMDRAEFGELLSYVGLGAEQNLGDKLFYIFDDDNSGTVDYKELIIGLEMFKENSIDDKLRVFMELCDTDGNGNINPDQLYNVLKQNLFTHDDKVKLKGIVRQIFKECDTNGDGVLDKEELYKATSTNTLLLALLDESVKNVKRVDQIIENDLEEPFHCWVPISANFVNYKEGIHFGLVNKLLKVVENVENGYQFRKDTRQKFKEALNMGKTQKELETLKEDSLNESYIDEQN